MSLLRRARVAGHRLRSLFQRDRTEADLQRELDLHLEQLTKEHIADGMSETDARLFARRAFGSVEWTKEQCRDMRRVNVVDDLVKDLVYALRLLRKSPGFTLTAVLSLALGIGANTAIFSIVNAFLLRPLPFDRPERLVQLFERDVVGNEAMMSLAPGNFLDWQAAATTFESMSALTTQTSTLAGDAAGLEPQQVVICGCSGNLFTTLGVSPALGRAFRPDEDKFGAARTIVISHNLWQRVFAGAPDVVGRTVRLNDRESLIIGVMPRHFGFPQRNVDVWIPIMLGMAPATQVRHDLHFIRLIGRLRPDVSIEQARAELSAIAASYKNAHPQESTGKAANVIPLHDVLVNDARTPLVVLLAAVCCVLLIACVNIANLMLTRASARAREMGIRTALGAGRGRIVRQLITESVLLGLAGGAAGVALAIWIARLLAARAPGAEAILPTGGLTIDPVVFLFAFVVAIGTGVAVGFVPALRGTRGDVTNDLKEGGRSSTGGRAHVRFRDLLVTAEVALSLVLLVAAGLLLHSFSRLYDVQPGVRMDHVVTMTTLLPTTRYRDAAQRSAFLTQASERIRALPGVKSAGFVSCTPLTGSCNVIFFYIEGRPFQPGKFVTAMERTADLHYFTAAGIPLLRGRTFTSEDGVGWDAKNPRPGKIVISESMAKTYFANEDPIGKRIFFDFELQRERNEGFPVPRYEIIGVVGDVLPTLADRIAPTFYRPMLDVANSGFSIVVHTATEPQSAVAAIRNEIRRMDSALAISQVRTMDEIVDRSTADRRFTMLLFASFAGLAVLLAVVGLYGVVSYAVSQRTAEIGIRMALGATSVDVSRFISMQGLKPAIAGITLGVIAAVFASRVLRSLLFGVTPVDPLTFLLVPPLLLAVAWVACYIPARRAARLDPTRALRFE